TRGSLDDGHLQRDADLPSKMPEVLLDRNFPEVNCVVAGRTNVIHLVASLIDNIDVVFGDFDLVADSFTVENGHLVDQNVQFIVRLGRNQDFAQCQQHLARSQQRRSPHLAPISRIYRSDGLRFSLFDRALGHW
ncbi:hypothetical protein PENTCL1PPCAC_771, partial [Pristionchus entomophagus]